VLENKTFFFYFALGFSSRKASPLKVLGRGKRLKQWMQNNTIAWLFWTTEV